MEVFVTQHFSDMSLNSSPSVYLESKSFNKRVEETKYATTIKQHHTTKKPDVTTSYCTHKYCLFLLLYYNEDLNTE